MRITASEVPSILFFVKDFTTHVGFYRSPPVRVLLWIVLLQDVSAADFKLWELPGLWVRVVLLYFSGLLFLYYSCEEIKAGLPARSGKLSVMLVWSILALLKHDSNSGVLLGRRTCVTAPSKAVRFYGTFKLYFWNYACCSICTSL